MKTCNKCKIEKSLDNFPPRKSSVGPYCLDCKKEYDREYYNKTSDKRKSYKKKNNKVIRKRNLEYIRNFLKDKSCIDCDESDIIVLEFDHRENKEYNISEMAYYSLEKIKKEIEKCDIRCANCHRRKTFKQFGWTSR
jgi:hypothetical protein